MTEHSNFRREESNAGARRTLVALVVLVLVLFAAATAFMVLEGNRRAPEGRPVLAVLPVEPAMSDSATSRYAGFGQGLASYFARADPMILGVLGPVSTARVVTPRSDPLAVGVELGATMVLLGHEIVGDSGPTLVMELLRVDDGTALWRREFRVGSDVDLRALRIRIGAEVTEVLDLPR
jgi:TolB-like protein